MEFANSTTEKQELPAVQGGRRRVASRISAEMQLNSIFDDVNVIGGSQKTPISAGAQRSFIIGGANNVINVGSNDSFIAGGTGNAIGAPCAAILGGQGNAVGHAYAAVFGNGITSVATDTFHVSCLNAVNTPTRPGGPILPSGTIFRYDASLGPVPAGALPLYVMP